MLTSRPQIHHEVFRPETYRFDITLTEKYPRLGKASREQTRDRVEHFDLDHSRSDQKTARDQVMPSVQLWPVIQLGPVSPVLSKFGKQHRTFRAALLPAVEMLVLETSTYRAMIRASLNMAVTRNYFGKNSRR